MQFNWQKETRNFEPTFKDLGNEAKKLEEIRVSIEKDNSVTSDSPIRQKLNELSTKFTELKDKGEKANDELKKGVKRAWSDFQHSVEQARREMTN